MGTTPSKSAGANRNKRTRRSKREQPIRSEVHSNRPIKDESTQSAPIKSKSDEHLHSKQPISSRNYKNQPIREKTASRESVLVDRGTNTESHEQQEKHKKRKPKKQKQQKVSEDTGNPGNGEVVKENSVQKNEKSKRNGGPTENGKPKPKRLSYRKQKEQIEKEKKQQRVSKDQLRSLASTLQRTSWYLGRRLGMEEAQVKRYGTSFATEEERKYQILLWWRRVRGWKATRQQLVILLELGQYTEKEYKAILTSSNGDVTIYDKPPDIEQENRKDNEKREPYHSDVIKPNVQSYGNMSYEDAVEAQQYERKQEPEDEKRRERRKHDRGREHQKHRSRHQRGHQEMNVNTLPSWWKKPGDTLERKPKTTPKEVIYAEIPRKASAETEAVIESNESQENLHSPPPDGTQSTTSHTDDSGIVTSPPMSPKQVETDQSEARTQEKPDEEVGTPKGDSTTKATTNTMTREPKRSSKTLVVRRCSDSAVKLRYTSLSDEKPRISKPVEPAIKEYESGEELEQIFSNNGSNNDVTKDYSDVTKTQGDVTKRKRSHNKGSNSDVRKERHSDITKSTNIYTDDVTGSYDSITGDDITNSNYDITMMDYKTDIQGMVQKYETLTKLHEVQNRESMSLSIKRHWENTNGSLPREFSQQSHHTSRTSLSSAGSRSTTRSKTNTLKHGHRSSKYMQRYHFFTFGGKGRFPSRFKGLISGLAILNNGHVVASDGDNKRIQIFDKRGRFITTFDTNTELKPKGVCVTPDENIAVCCGDSVNVYGRDGQLHLSFGQGVFRNNSYSICCDTKSNYYVTDIVSHTISIHDSKGRIRKRFGFQGTSMIHFNQPVSLSINRKKQLLITDSQNHCIKVYTLSGRPLFRIGAKGSADGLFWNPLGTCVDDNDHLYVADCGNNRISEFDSDGNFMRQVLTEEDGIWMPSLIQINKLGQLIVCEWEKQHIKVFTIETAV